MQPLVQMNISIKCPGANFTDSGFEWRIENPAHRALYVSFNILTFIFFLLDMHENIGGVSVIVRSNRPFLMRNEEQHLYLEKKTIRGHFPSQPLCLMEK